MQFLFIHLGILRSSHSRRKMFLIKIKITIFLWLLQEVQCQQPAPAPPPPRTLADTLCFNTKILSSPDDKAVEEALNSTLSEVAIFPETKPSIYGMKDRLDKLEANTLHYSLSIDLDKLAPGYSLNDIKAIIVQVDTHQFGGFGQFFDCSLCTSSSVELTGNMIVPCDYSQSVEPLPPTVFVFSAPAPKPFTIQTQINNTNPFWKNQDTSPYKVDLYWKFSHTMCNHPKKITFRGFILISDNEQHLYTTNTPLAPSTIPYMIPPIVVALGEIFPPDESPAPHIFRPSLSQIKETDLYDLNDRVNFPWIWWSAEDYLTAEMKDPQCKECPDPTNCDIIRSGSYFGCNAEEEMPTCNFDKEIAPTEDDFAEEVKNYYQLFAKDHPVYEEYEEYIKNRLEFYCFCPIPKRLAEGEPSLISRYSLHFHQIAPRSERTMKEDEKHHKTYASTKANRSGIHYGEFPGQDIANFRVAHGVTQVIATMFFTPILLLTSRHYKETFLNKHVVYYRYWYVIHILVTFINFHLHAMGWLASRNVDAMIGESSDKDQIKIKNHIWTGYGVLGLFGAGCLTGGIRCMSIKSRHFGMSLHWFFGMAYYALSLWAVINSVEIPGSPSNAALHIEKWEKETGGPKEMEDRTLWIVVIWAAVDLGFHITLEILGCFYSWKHKIKRPLSLVIVPVLYEYNRADFPGFKIRRAILWIYVITAGAASGYLCYLMASPFRKDAHFGAMTCTHDPKNASVYKSRSLEGCDFSGGQIWRNWGKAWRV